MKHCDIKGVTMPEKTWADKGRYPLIKSENRGGVAQRAKITKKVHKPLRNHYKEWAVLK